LKREGLARLAAVTSQINISAIDVNCTKTTLRQTLVGIFSCISELEVSIGEVCLVRRLFNEALISKNEKN
jgi:hypothetical protein